MPLYDEIGKGYDRTRQADPYLCRRIRHHLRLIPGGRYLDVACGTGNYTLAIHRQDTPVIGIDTATQMIGAARRKEGSVSWCLGNVAALPFPNDSFTGAFCVLGIHHFDNIRQVFTEVYRVLSSGRFVIFTATPGQMEGYWLNHYFPKAMRKSMDKMPDRGKVTAALKRAGFGNIESEAYEVQENLKDLFLYSGKHRPEFYLNPEVRQGISTFAALAGQDEVSEGCRQLEKDITSGDINGIIASYLYRSSGRGDYLFLTGEKKQ
ncbi:MAG: class I SAM-dependent methyltransferase [Chloroflexota bacterium]